MNPAADTDSPSGAPLLDPGRNCWRVEKANRATLIVDACDYYRVAREAMLKAESQIILIGWDVDTRVHLVEKENAGGAPVALGPLLSWLSKRRPDLKIYVLPWDEGLLSVPGRGTTMFRMLRWAVDKKVSLKWDSTHPLDASHHQKILVIDDKIGFCGGIDITASRWDTREHKDEEPGRRRPFTGRAYEPWHDAIMAVDGDAALALGELARKRWKAATGKQLPAARPSGNPWPEELEPMFSDVEVGIARTRGKAGSYRQVREAEALFVDMIGRARRFIYVETQYFASRVIGEAIAGRLGGPNPPECLIINPKRAYGWLDEEVMSPARYELVKALEKVDHKDRFRIYTPTTENGTDIYVHAKIMIVDDLYLRVGSANLNNRSMGLDSECCLLIDGSEREDVQQMIARIRSDLMAEHLGVERAEVEEAMAERNSLIAVVEKLRGEGRTLHPFTPEKPNKIERAIATSELLDPEAPNELFEPRVARPGLLSRLRRGRG